MGTDGSWCATGRLLSRDLSLSVFTSCRTQQSLAPGAVPGRLLSPAGASTVHSNSMLLRPPSMPFFSVRMTIPLLPSTYDVGVFACAGGKYTGAAINPARLIAPAIVFFCTPQKAFWFYLIGEIVGAMIAAIVATGTFGAETATPFDDGSALLFGSSALQPPSHLHVLHIRCLSFATFKCLSCVMSYLTCRLAFDMATLWFFGGSEVQSSASDHQFCSRACSAFLSGGGRARPATRL